MSKRVMVVDDSRIVHAQMKKMLSGTDFEVAGCYMDGRSAIEGYGDVKPDVVTMDIIMPDMDGLETARMLLERWPDARVLMLSSLAYDDTIETAENIGAKGFIYKPFDRESLLAELNRALED